MLRATLSLCLSFCILTAHAATPETAPATPLPAAAEAASTSSLPPPVPAAVLETVVVSGEQPGPGLWKISKDEHVLWILGTLSPLPKKISWVSREVESVIAGAQQVLLPPQASVKVKGGVVGGLFLLPSLLKARNNPDGKRLADVVPAELYARWQPLKQKYLGRNQGVEKRRPIFAAAELFSEALDKAGLRGGGKVAETVEKLAERHKVELVRPEVALKLDGARDTLRDFAKSDLDDIDCLRRTVERLESDLPAMQLRANAWAVGDIQALRDLPYVDQNQACAEAMLQNSAVQEHGMGDLRERIARVWLESAETALTRHTVSLAVLPMDQVLGADGYVAELQRRGYTVEAPE